MKPSGYSDKPLIEKLGYLPADTLWLLNGPVELREYFLTHGLTFVAEPPATWLHGFFHTRAALDEFVKNTDFVTIEKGLWFSWPKRASGVPTDLTEQTFRDVLLPMGWVDTKVAAIDQTWSGLKFLRRKQ